MNDEEREEYRRSRAEDVLVEQRVLDAIGEAVKGSKWEVPNGVLTEVLVCMNFVDDDRDHMLVWLHSGSWAMAEGMASRVIRDVEARENFNRQRGRDED